MSDSILTNIDRFTQKLGPINSLLEILTERLVTKKQEASACGGVYCLTLCSGSCGSGVYHAYSYYSANQQYCDRGYFNCSVYRGCVC